MQLKSDIDKDIQLGLIAHGITFPIDGTGKIAIHEFRIDTQANIGMLYVLPKAKLPDGTLPCLVIPAKYLYGVFYFDRKAAIIEIGTMAFDGPIADWYIKNKG